MKLLLLAPILGLAAPAPRAGDPPPSAAATAFDPRRHGFDFVNSFEGDMLIDVPLVGRVDVGDAPYGLCGGMSFAALDSFYAGVEVPDFASGSYGLPPQEFESGEPLRSYVYGRQMDSLRADDARLVRRLVTWIPRPIHSNWLMTGLAELTKRAFDDKVRPALDEGCPVPLCLVKADFDDMLPDPTHPTLPPGGFTENHQVVAIGYRRHSAGPDHWDVDVYDPNYPDEIHTLHLKLRVQTARVRSDGTLFPDADDPDENRRGRFRGFFRTPYEPHDAPWSTAATASAPQQASRRNTLARFALPAGEVDAEAPPPAVTEVGSWLGDLEERVAALEQRAHGGAPGAVVCLDVASDFRPIHATRSLPAGVSELSIAVERAAAARFRELEVVFVALEVGDAAPSGTELARSRQPTARDDPARFRYRQEVPLPPGTYRADLFGDGAPWCSLPFQVERCAGPETTPSFPIEAGRRWTYDFVQTAGEGVRLVDGEADLGNRMQAEVELRVVEAGAGPAHIELRGDGRTFAHEWWTWDARGLVATRRIVDGEEFELAPPQPLLAAAPGVSAWEYVNPELGVAQRCRQWGPLELSGPWGSEQGFLVRAEQAEGELAHTVEREFVPGIGMVRERITTARAGHLVSSQELVLRPGSAR